MNKSIHKKIVFFEVQDWEKKLLKKAFPKAILTNEKLSSDTASLASTATVVSVFVYSDLKKEVLTQLPNLQYIATRSTGFDHIDIAFCKQKNILVSNVPEYGSNTVAEHTFALILSLSRKIYHSVNQAKQLNFDHSQIRGVDLFGKTLGIIGLGKIGLNVLRIAKGFGMSVVVSTHHQNSTLQHTYSFKYLTLDHLIKVSDFITLHLPLTPQTKHIINKKCIQKMKKGTFLINTARGGLIDTKAVIEGLNNDILAGVALDVLEEEKELTEEAAILTPWFHQEADMETLVMDHYLMAHPKVLITPHNAFNSVEALHRIIDTTIKNMHGFLSKLPQNIVSS